MKYPVTLIIVFITGLAAHAEVRLPNFFGDHMVLQQQTSNAVWGFASPGEYITVEASWGAQNTVTADPEGKWKVFLETPAAGTGHSLSVTGENTITIDDVAIGEVWIAFGQSNMGWSVGNSFAAEGEADVDLPDLRLFRSSREHWHEPLDENRDRLAQWKRCDPESAAETAAVAYYFGKKLQQELGVPVGIIQRAFAGTPIEGWMPWDIQQDDPRTIVHRENYDTVAVRTIKRGDNTEAQALVSFQNELAAYHARVDAGDIMKSAVKRIDPPIITKPATLGHQYPGHIFNAMVNPLVPYGMRGAIWYQGERNSKNVPQAEHYRQQLAQLINFYRSLWHENSAGNVSAEFPFQFTQLPSWTPAQATPVEGLTAPWATNREAMRLVAEEVPNTGMVVAIDTGDLIALHPKNKKPLGHRHALLALQKTYGKNITGEGPRFNGETIKGEQLILNFETNRSALTAARSSPLDSFAIAGSDRVWQWADAKIKGNTIILSSIKVPQPVAARYAWAMNPSQRNLLYNQAGFPASPFRTDTWPLHKPGAPLVEVKKPKKPDDYVSTDWPRPALNP
ncbi:MAG: sialate O-acetylesterase [Opitutaceae bacterium]